jgi:tetratricopeptide (TPR) repeat protein
MLCTTARTFAVVGAILMFSSTSFAIQLMAPDEPICDMRADSALGLEDYPTAIELHRRVLRSHPYNALAHYHLGFAYGMEGRSVEEIGEYRQAATLGLHNWDLFLNLGLAYAERLELANALPALKRAVSLAPERVETHFNLALVYEQESRLNEALSEITLARRLDPQDLDVENTNAVLCTEISDLVCARNLWTHLVRTAPEYYPARINLAIISRTPNAGPLDLQRYSDPLQLTGASRANRSE